MRVLVFTSLFPNLRRPDFGIFICQRTAHLARRPGNFVRVVAPVPYFPGWFRSSRWSQYGALPRQQEIHGLTVFNPRYPLLPGLMPLHGVLMFLGSCRLVSKLQRQHRFDCIDAHYVYPDGFAAVLIGKVLRLPVVLSARGTDINVFPSFTSIRPMIRWSLNNAAGVVAVSDALRVAITDLGVPAEKIRTIPNGIDAERFHPIAQPEGRSALGLPTDSGKVLVSVGSLTEGKNHLSLLSAFARLLPELPDARLFIIGEGPLRPLLEQKIRALQLGENARLVGARRNQELALWFSAADISVLVSTREGWPNVVMESIACGTPVVATRVGGVPEIINSPDLGMLTDQDVDAIALTLRAALAKTWDRAAVARHGQLRSWDVVAGEVEQYLTSRLSG
jgi:teichuronic acid biosynthesis glycosyltransferase TuaC